jgi:protein HOOK3
VSDSVANGLPRMSAHRFPYSLNLFCRARVYSAPDYFDPTTIARHLDSNWALKSSNLRKLLRNLENFYHAELGKDSDWSAVDVQKVARHGDSQNISVLCHWVAAAAVTCTDKNVYVQRIMSMSPDSQKEMKSIIVESMKRLTEHVVEDEEGGDENEVVFGQGNSSMEQVDEDDNLNDTRQQLFGATANLQQQLEELQHELNTIKANAAVAAEDNHKSESKLRALVEDLQDRLMKRQDELIQVEEDLQQAVATLEETKSKLAEAIEQKAALEDDLDVAKAKAQQLYKAEATVVAYKKKLEGVGVINQQMEELEGQAEKYLQQIMELEAEVKKSTALQKTVTAQEAKIAVLEKNLGENASSTKNTAGEISDLKTRLSAAENAKKMFEEELNELRAKQQADSTADALSPMSKETAPLQTPEQREKSMRLEIENKQLREQVERLTTLSSASIAPDTANSPEAAALKAEVQRLLEAYAAKEQENAKLASDKDKLESYTKRTLAKFQDKYLVALQECKAKLKEKQDKIEQLEKRGQTERSTQKREERLLSSTIYELGLGIMQQKLKHTSLS